MSCFPLAHLKLQYLVSFSRRLNEEEELMKKRTLVCFLIFILCVFYSSIPGTVFGQDADPTPEELAQRVYKNDEYKATLLRVDLQDLVVQVLVALSDPSTLADAQPIIDAVFEGDFGGALDAILDSPGLITTVVPTATDETIALLRNDEEIRNVLENDDVRTLMQNADAVKALLRLLLADETWSTSLSASNLETLQDALGIDDITKPDPPDPTPPTLSITTSSPTTSVQGSFDVAFTTADANGDPVTVTGSISVDPVEAAAYYSIPSGTLTSPVRITQTAPTTAMPTIPSATVTLTLTANDGTADSTPAAIVLTFAAAEKPPVTPEPPPGELPPANVVPSPITDESLLGGLSLNRVHGRAFIRSLIQTAAQDFIVIDNKTADENVERVVEYILSLVPNGDAFLPKKLIRQNLYSTQPYNIFDEPEDSQLDPENFGNAIAPDLAEFIYTDVDNVTKFLASDDLDVYVRVPSTLEGGSVKFGINGKVKDAVRITPDIFQQDTIPYIFELEEKLAATNLPAWPDPNFDNQLFSGVELRYSQTGIDGEYISVDMEEDVNPETGGVVWVKEIGVPPPKEKSDPAANIYYYFEVTLAEEVMLEIINPEALGVAIQSTDGTHSLDATKTYTFDSWRMPDPRNLQISDRGLFKELFSPKVAAAIAPIALALYNSENVEDVVITGKQQQALQNALLESTSDLFNKFEQSFDPMLVSVFSLPYVDNEKESLWYANLGPIKDGNVTLDARVIDGNDVERDQIVVEFIADDSAPEATVKIGPGNDYATGYWNEDGVFVATASMKDEDGLRTLSAPDDTPVLVNINSTVTKGDVGHGLGYLIYQLINLDEHGRPLSTWMPLTVQNSMLASDIWKLIQANLTDENAVIDYEGIPIDLRNFDFRTILDVIKNGLPGIISADALMSVLISEFDNLTGIELTNEQYALYRDLLGAVIDDINLIPFTSDPTRMFTADPSKILTMPIQGNEMPLLYGDYGIRAMGIDTLFNVGSHVAPTKLRVVMPEWDRSSITLASLGDLNGDGDADEPYESGTIYRNATDVTLTVVVDERTVHPGKIEVEYKGADGTWHTIKELELTETPDPVAWEVTNFDSLVMAGTFVEVRTVTTNDLELVDISETVNINLVDDVHPVDPKVLAVDFDESSIMATNPDSGAPQGTIQLHGYTPRVTYPETNSILVEVKRMQDGEDEWEPIATVVPDPDNPVNYDPNDGTAAKLMEIVINDKALGDRYPSDASMIHIDETSSYLKWLITVDTTMLEAGDTITKDNPGARNVAMDDNRYMVRATPVVDGSTYVSTNDNENPTAEGDYTEMFSVDNDDDVAPLGPTNVVEITDDTGTVVTQNADGSYTVGGLVDKYDLDEDGIEGKSPEITLTLKATAERPTYEGVKLITDLPEGADISPVTETEMGSGIFTVTIDVGTLMENDDPPNSYNDRYLEDVYHPNPMESIYNPKGESFSFTVYALAYDEADAYDEATAADEMFQEYGNIQANEYEDDEVTVNVVNSYRPDPGVIAISIVNSDDAVNPDSGAPQGELTFNVYTYYRTSAPTDGIRVEVKRPVDETWERIAGTAEEPTAVEISEVTAADLSDIISNSSGITNSGVISGLVDIASEQSEGSPSRLMKWTFVVPTRELALEDTVVPDNTIRLEDTIEVGDEAERDVTKDTMDYNQYKVRAWSLTPKNKDNRAEYAAREGVEAFFSLDNVDDVPPLGPTNITDVADVAGSIPADEDDGIYTVGGIVDDTVPSPVATFTIEATADPNTYEGGKVRLVRADAPDDKDPKNYGDLNADGIAKVTIDVGLLENGIYMYHALTVDAFGNEQDDGSSPSITVHVLNFRVSDITELMVTAVDGVMVDGELPDRIPLRESIEVSFNVNNGSLAVGDLTGVLVDGHEVTFTAGGEAKAFSLMADKLSEVADGWYTPEGRVTKRNGSVTFPLATINLDNTGPMISITTPAEGHTVNHLPTLQADFHDGELGIGVSADNTAMVSLARLRPEEVEQDAVAIDVDQNMVEQDIDSLVYTRTEMLAGGAYQFTIMVTDNLGNVGEQTVSFAVEGLSPTVVITAPASGQKFDQSPDKITGFYSGGGEVSITKFTINDAEVMAEVDGNNFSHALAQTLEEGDHTVTVEVTDGSGLTAQTSLTFTVELPVPTVSIDTPTAGQIYGHGMPVITGSFSGAGDVGVELSVDGEVVEATVNNNEYTYTPAEALGHGEHMVSVEVTDANGRTAMTSLMFSVDIPGPSVMIHSPASGQMYDHGSPVVSGEFDGTADVSLTTFTINGEAAEAMVEGNGFTYTPDPGLDDGEYTILAEVTDANGKTADATVIFSVRLPIAMVSIDSPAAGQIYDHGMPVISGDFSGAGDVVVKLSIDGDAVEASVNDNNEFTYTPADVLSEGEHMVAVEVTDANGRTAMTSTVFSIAFPIPTVSIHSPAAGSTFSHGKPAITGEFTGVGAVDVKLTVNGKDAEAKVEGNQFSHTLADALGHGEHMIAVEVTDSNGKSAQTSTVFMVDIAGPSVAILSPASGQTYEHGEPVIRAEFAGMTDVEVTTFTINGEDVALAEDAVEDNQFAYTPDPALGDGEHTIVVGVTDANGKTAREAVVFVVAIPKDSSPPIISEVSPSGLVRLNQADILAENMAITISAVIVEEQSSILNMQYIINDGAPSAYPVDRAASKFEITESFTPGTHYIKLIVESEGGTREHSWQFVLEVDETAPIISSITPAGTFHGGLPTISASATDASGVETITIVVMDSNGEEVEGETSDDAEDRTNDGITRLDFHPEAPLSEGTYSIAVRAIDTFGNSSTQKGNFTIDFDTAPPIITTSSPQNGARLMYKHDEEARPVISVSYGDSETGVNPDSVRLVIEAPTADGGSQAQPINLTDEQMSATQVIYTPAAPAFPNGFDVAGQYTVTLEVSDNAHQEGNVSDESDGARTANMTVYKFTFSVEHMDAPVLKTVFNFPNPFVENTRISFGLNQMSTVSIVIFDSTLRQVRTLRDNEVLPAGNYTGQNGIGWDGKSSNGEDLARGIYYCQIMVTGGFETEVAILKLALTR